MFTILIIVFSASTSVLSAGAVPAAIEETNAILNNVLKINTTLYSTPLYSNSDTQEHGVQQSEVDYWLISDNGSVRVSASFVNNTLKLLYLTEYSGDLANPQPATDTGKMATNFLENYQTFTGDSFYGSLAQMLNGVTGHGSFTKTSGNIQLQVNNAGQATVDYVWTYTNGGISAQTKNVILSYYHGQLNVFLDNWHLYNVVGSPKISREQAITIALAYAQNYTYEVGNSTISLSGFKFSNQSLTAAKLSYVNSPMANSARDNNPLNLYPSWWIPIGFDRFYPGDVSGIAVTVWADTGEVSSAGLMHADSNFANIIQPTIQPTPVQSVDSLQSSSPTPSPSIPEIPCTLAALIGIMVVSLTAVFLYVKRS